MGGVGKPLRSTLASQEVPREIVPSPSDRRKSQEILFGSQEVFRRSQEVPGGHWELLGSHQELLGSHSGRVTKKLPKLEKLQKCIIDCKIDHLASLGPPWRAVRAPRPPIEPKSSRIQPKSSRIKARSNQIQPNRIKFGINSKSKSNQSKSKANPHQIKIHAKSYGNPQKSQEFIGNRSKHIEILGISRRLR